MTKIFVPLERTPGEFRVAITPETAKKFCAKGAEVFVEKGAGNASGFLDSDYLEAGAKIPALARSAWKDADIVLKVAAPSVNTELGGHEVDFFKPGSLLVGLLNPIQNLETVKTLTNQLIDAISMEFIPRITRAQSMDALSSQANIAGYKSVLLASTHLDKYFPLLMTAAGTVKPAKVVIMGAGVAGLQAIATARRLGAVVEVSDIRPEVEEQVQSLGARFIELPMKESGAGEGGYAKEMGEDFLTRQREIVARHVAVADVVITTALIPGRPAPKLVSRDMVESMRPGSVIVDLAVAAGGNCELSEKDQDVNHGGVKILGPSNLAATMAKDASLLYARNLDALLSPFFTEGSFNLDLEDEVIDGSLFIYQGEVRNERVRKALEGGNA